MRADLVNKVQQAIDKVEMKVTKFDNTMEQSINLHLMSQSLEKSLNIAVTNQVLDTIDKKNKIDEEIYAGLL